MRKAIGTGFFLEPLDGRHDRSAFNCGVESLDRYLHQQASQDIRRKASAVFVLVGDEAPHRILGYATLAAFALERGFVPEEARRFIPRYPVVSATLIGRLAIDRSQQSKGLGSLLLASILRIADESTTMVGSSMIVVDAIDESATSFYEKHGFIPLENSMRLLLPIHMIGKNMP